MVAAIDTQECSPPVMVVERKKVLVVDDEPLVCWSVAETLAESGYEVIEAYDAASAVHAVSPPARPPDVVLLDLFLPDSTDLALLSTLRRLVPATAIVVITAHGNPELREEAHRIGAQALLDKPVEISALAPLVARALAARPQ